MAGFDASDLAARLAGQAEAVCRHYLSNGTRQGGYWLVGDVRNTPGRSMFVRLKGPQTGKGAAGKWTDAATGEHGDLLDVIRETCGLPDFKQIAEEARRFLSLPHPDPAQEPRRGRMSAAPMGSPEAARRLFAMAQPIRGTLAETYLRRRGITSLHETGSLRFHPRCYYRPDEHASTEIWPAIIAAVTDLNGELSRDQRVMLIDADPQGSSLDWSEARAREGLPRQFAVIGLARDTLHREAPELARGADHVVIDGPPRVAGLMRSALLAADLVLIPVQPSPFDGWASAEMLALLREARLFRPSLVARFVLNRCGARTVIARETAKALAEHDPPVLASAIGQRVGFADAAQSGRLISELDGQRAGAREVAALCTEVGRLAP